MPVSVPVLMRSAMVKLVHWPLRARDTTRVSWWKQLEEEKDWHSTLLMP